ncbi:MAG: hypothetical protein K2I64_00990 [Muribaculaceae bacterium]|nr:hypothetical protein [Muribaculaceae bacterium]
MNIRSLFYLLAIFALCGCSGKNDKDAVLYNNRVINTYRACHPMTEKINNSALDTLSLEQIKAELHQLYSQTSNDSGAWFLNDLIESNFPLYLNSPIDSCVISYVMGDDPGIDIKIILSKQGSIIQFEDAYSDEPTPIVVAYIPLYHTAAIYEYLDRIYVSKTAKARVSSDEKRTPDYSEVMMYISIYCGEKIITNIFFVDGPRFSRGTLYDYSYEMSNVITIVNQLVRDFLNKIGEDFNVFEDSDLRVIRNN